MQSCTLKELQDRLDDQIKYVACQMDPSNNISEWTGKAVRRLSHSYLKSLDLILYFYILYFFCQCSDSVNVTWANVEACSKGPIGTQLQLDAEEATHQIAKPYPAFIPTIVYDRVGFQ